MPRHDYVLIVGQGRSGTNWLLELLELSPETFCRNEPYGASESPFKQLTKHRWVVQPDQRELEEHWDAAVDWTRLRIGDRDHRIHVRKNHIHQASRLLGLYQVAAGRRPRRVLAFVARSLRGEEWRIPWWVGSLARLEQSMPVLKLVTAPGWAAFVLAHRRGIPVLHIIRHPGGFLNSWSQRYLALGDPAQIRQANEARLREIVAADTAWGPVFGDIEQMSVEESELWYWHYANEAIYQAGRTSADYHRIIYEDLVADPAGVMRRLYEASGVTWSASVEESVQATASDSNVADAWRDGLSTAHLHLVERFTAAAANTFYRPGESDRSE